MFVHSWFLYKRIPCVTVSALQPTQMCLPYSVYINTYLLRFRVPVKWWTCTHLSDGIIWNNINGSLSLLPSTSYWLLSWRWSLRLWGSGTIVQLWCMREFPQANSSLFFFFKTERTRGTDVGGGLLTALTAVRDEKSFRTGNDLTFLVGGKPSLTSTPTALSIPGHSEHPQRAEEWQQPSRREKK